MSEAQAPVAKRALRVLLVDDDEQAREGYKACCELAGFEAETAADAESAIARIRGRRPDVIVMDYSMPGMNGIELLNVIRENPALRRIPVIMVSGRDRDLQSVHGAPWLRKPVLPEALIEHIRRAAEDVP
jgi:CheY-like chemotaxis protein